MIVETSFDFDLNVVQYFQIAGSKIESSQTPLTLSNSTESTSVRVSHIVEISKSLKFNNLSCT